MALTASQQAILASTTGPSEAFPGQAARMARAYGSGNATPGEFSNVFGFDPPAGNAGGVFPGQAARATQAFVGGNISPGEFVGIQGMTPSATLPRYGALGSNASAGEALLSQGLSQDALGGGSLLGGGPTMPPPYGPLASESESLGARLLASAGTGAGPTVPPPYGPLATTGAAGAEAAPLVAGAEGAGAAGTGLAGAESAVAGKAGFLASKLSFLDAIPGVNMANAKFGLGAGVAVGGQFLGGMADNQNFGGENSNWDQGITGAIKGLGLGGGAALALGMAGPAGWAVAGTAALLGGLMGAQAEGGTTAERMQKVATQSTKTIQTLGTQFGLNKDDLDNIMLQHQATIQLLMNNKDKKGLDAYVDSLSSTLPQQMLAYHQQREQQDNQAKRQLAMQGTFAPIFNSIQSRSAQDNQVAYQNAVGAADQLQATNPQLASLIKANASVANQSSDAIMAAYAAQMSTVPNQADAAGYYQGQNLLSQYTLPGTQQIQQPGQLTKSQQNQLAQLQMLQQAQAG